MKNKGFVSTAVIYAFFILFLLLMMFLLNSYASKRLLRDRLKEEIKENDKNDSYDIVVNFYIYNTANEDYVLTSSIPPFLVELDHSNCDNGSEVNYDKGKVTVTAQGKDTCDLYFKRTTADIVLRVYTKDNKNAEKVEVKEVPNDNYYSYTADESSCNNNNNNNNVSISYNPSTGFTINSSNDSVSSPIECEAVFTKKRS